MKRRPIIILGLLLLCLPAFAASTNDSGPPADILAVRNIEIIFHTAGSVLPSKDLELMMSLYADDAVLTDTAHENKVYRGKDQVRTYWAEVSGPFRPEHHWIGYTPAMRIKAGSRRVPGSSPNRRTANDRQRSSEVQRKWVRRYSAREQCSRLCECHAALWQSFL